MRKIIIKNLSKSFKIGSVTRNILHDCNLEIGANETVGLLGLNGSGKTTLMKILAGVEELSGGKKIINGNISWPVGIYSGLINNITVEQNITLMAELLNINAGRLLERVLVDANLSTSRENLVKNLSSGMKAKLGFVLATSIDFDFFIFDELTAVGDKFFKELFYKKIIEIKRDKTIIMTSHDNKMIEEYCDYAYIIDKQTISKKYSINDAIEKYNMVTG